MFMMWNEQKRLEQEQMESHGNSRPTSHVSDPRTSTTSRGSSEYSDQSYNEYQIGEASPDTSPMNYRPRSLTPPPDRRDYVPQPQPLSYIELNRLPVVKLQGHELHTKCACEKPWQKDEEALQLLCGHKLHTACGCKLMETGVCPICKTAEIMDDKLREIRIDLSGFNF